MVSTVATPGEWQCQIRTGGVRRLAVANWPNIFQMLLVFKSRMLKLRWFDLFRICCIQIERENLNSHIDLHTRAGCVFDKHVTFDLFTSGSMHAGKLPCTVCLGLPSLLLISQVEVTAPV